MGFPGRKDCAVVLTNLADAFEELAQGDSKENCRAPWKRQSIRHGMRRSLHGPMLISRGNNNTAISLMLASRKFCMRSKRRPLQQEFLTMSKASAKTHQSFSGY